jgi:hypothetical protein
MCVDSGLTFSTQTTRQRNWATNVPIHACRCKAVSQHSSYSFTTSALDGERSHFTPGERTPSTYWTRLDGPQSQSGLKGYRKNICLCWGTNLDRLVIQSVARHQTPSQAYNTCISLHFNAYTWLHPEANNRLGTLVFWIHIWHGNYWLKYLTVWWTMKCEYANVLVEILNSCPCITATNRHQVYVKTEYQALAICFSKTL